MTLLQTALTQIRLLSSSLISVHSVILHDKIYLGKFENMQQM